MGKRKYDGDPLDGTVQYLGEAPYWGGDGETVAATDREPEGEVETEGVPMVGDDGRDDDRGEVERPEQTGQTTLDAWGGDL